MVDYVFLSGEPVMAQLEPAFIIQVGSVLYVTKAIWEYDSSKALSPDQMEGCAAIAQEFESLGPANLIARQRADGAGGGGDGNQTGAQM
jgi:hypothetical protein